MKTKTAQEMSILIVEDDTTLSEMLKAYFSAQGFKMLTTTWGQRAVEIAAHERPDLVLLDIHLPDIDGFEVCRLLRDSHQTRHIPVIFLTEATQRMDVIQGLALGVIDYITKPFDLQELRLRVRNIFHRTEMAQSDNIITGLPEEAAVLELLQRITSGGLPDHVLLVVRLLGLWEFRETYGFVAGDIVLHSISRTLQVAVSEISGDEGFCGHLDSEVFVLAVESRYIFALQARIKDRFAQSLEYFYPADKRSGSNGDEDHLKMSVQMIMPHEVHAQDARSLYDNLLNITPESS